MGEKIELKAELRRHLGAGKDSWFGNKLDEAVDFILAQPTQQQGSLPDGWRPDPEFVEELCDRLRMIAADERIKSAHTHLGGEIRRFSTIINVAANLLARVAPPVSKAGG